MCVNVDLFFLLSLSSPLLEAYFQESERQESAEMTRLFITGLLVCLDYFQSSSSFLYQHVTPPLTTHHFPALPTHWLFSVTPNLHLVAQNSFGCTGVMNQALLSPLKQAKKE